MADSDRLAELEQKFADNPRRYFAPLANELRKTGSLTRAIELCTVHLAEQPSHMSGQVVLGQALHDAGRGEEARVAFERAIELDPENLIALRKLGDIAAEQGDRDAATRWYERALDLDPRDEVIVTALAGLATAPRLYESTYEEPAATSAARDLGPIAEISEAETATPDATPETEAPPEPEPHIVWATDENTEPDAETEPEREPEMEPETEPAGAAEQADVTAPNDALGDDDESSGATDDWLLDRAEPGDTVEPASAAAIFEEQGFEVVDAEEAGIVAPAPFVTETMAELYAQQGFTGEALDIYRRLAATRDEPRLRARVDELEGELLARAPSGEPVADEPLSAEPASETPPSEMPASETPASVEPSADETTGDLEAQAPERGGGRTDAGAVVAAGPTVREFFARLGARKWEAPPAGAQPAAANGAAPGSLAIIFGEAAAPDDSAAAKRLSGAFPSGGS